MDTGAVQDYHLVPTPDGGELAELYRVPEFGQLTMRTIPPGARVGGHCHPNTDEWWIVARGLARVVLLREGGVQEFHFLQGASPEIVQVPKGTYHWLTNIGKVEVVLLFWASRVYDPAEPDKVMMESK